MIRAIVEIARNELLTALKTKRAVWVGAFYVASAALAGFVLTIVIHNIESMLMDPLMAQGMSAEEAASAISLSSEQSFVKMLAWFLDVEPDQVADVFRQSVIAPFFFWGSLSFLPFLIFLTSFDQVAADLQSRAICYSTLRASRTEILLGKLSAQTAIFVLLTIIASLVWLALATASVSSFSVTTGLAGVVRMLFLLLPFGLCYLAISTFCSSAFRQPIAALLAAFGIMMFLWAIGLLDKVPVDHELGLLHYGKYLSPSAYEDGLWLAGYWDPLVSSIAYLLFAAAFTSGAALILRRRDL
ncbi:MAG: hypothetical protein A2289_14880 [Deltaproteobacteria bacterium RIFOXYA12_FULL_58_15]|nr:MAG: hypothetical protein A2289_14880 [Deltaproteobacteria bacterium RIFOXYA12_FULL_58_15]OGR09758.1 MAG: hypothetical protein A2341_13170 [Deltaproteobacteria bacterium RIFOXYB12_FULL_58_9]